MNTQQKAVAVAIGAHFKRQWMTMGRDGPVARIDDDQSRLAITLAHLFQDNQPAFNENDFYRLIEETQNDYAF
jgi:hypothetical protein